MLKITPTIGESTSMLELKLGIAHQIAREDARGFTGTIKPCRSRFYQSQLERIKNHPNAGIAFRLFNSKGGIFWR